MAAHAVESGGTYVAVVARVVGDRFEAADLARRIGALNRALGVAAAPGGERLAMRVPLAAAFATTPDDVLLGLVHAPSDVVRTLLAMDAHLDGQLARVGIGVGTLDARVGADVRSLEGACLRAAREALHRAGRMRRWARVSGFGDAGDQVLNGMLALLGALRSEWTEKQARTVRLARRHETRKAVAVELRVSPSVVTESLAAARFAPLLEAESALSVLFALFDPPVE
jgi:hypothetical protein